MPPRFDPTRSYAPGVWQTDHAAWSPDGDLIVSIGYGQVPRRSPYQPGDWVVCHGYAGQTVGDSRHHGWRGYVLGSRGATYLNGITDDGRPWEERWGWLQPDGTRCSSQTCTCCPRPAPRQERPVVEQLDLFGLADAMGVGRG